MFDSKINVTGHVDLKLYNQYDELIDSRSVNNIITNAGKLNFLKVYGNIGAGVTPQYMKIGTGTSTPTVNDTTIATPSLFIPVYLGATGTKMAYNNVDVTTNGQPETNTNQVIWRATINANNGSSSAITEAGMFTASSGGDLCARCTFNALDKTSARLDIVWIVTFA